MAKRKPRVVSEEDLHFEFFTFPVFAGFVFGALLATFLLKASNLGLFYPLWILCLLGVSFSVIRLTVAWRRRREGGNRRQREEEAERERRALAARAARQMSQAAAAESSDAEAPARRRRRRRRS